MAGYVRGIYEVLLTEKLAVLLRDLDRRLDPRCDSLRTADAADRIALHLARVIQRVVAGVEEERRVDVGISLSRRLIDLIDEVISGAEVRPEAPVGAGSVLREILARLPEPAAAALVRQSDRRGAAPVGCHRSASALAVRLLRHPRRPRFA